jgi:mycothiol synthase
MSSVTTLACVPATVRIGEYAIRPQREDDAGPVFDVIHECELAEFGANWITEADLRVARSLMDLERDAWVVEDPGGSVIGAAAMRLSQPLAMFAFVSLLPAYRGRGIGTELLRLTEARAEEAIPEAPEGMRVVLRQNVGPHNEAARRLLEANGYPFARRFWTMAIDLADEPPPPVWPPGVRVAPLAPGEERIVFDAMDEAFADHWGYVPFDFEEWRRWMVDRPEADPSLWRLVWDGGELAAAALNRIRGEEGWVNVLGVRRRWRRRGLGLALLRESFREFRRRGLPQALLGVDSENRSGATQLYERAGMHVARSSDTHEKVLRDGAEPTRG